MSNPPHNLDAEKAVLGSTLINNDVLPGVVDLLSGLGDDAWYDRAHQSIWQAIIALYGQDKAVDSLTVYDRLAALGEADRCGGMVYLGELTQVPVTSANAHRYAEIVREAALLRKLLILQYNLQQHVDGATQSGEGVDKALNEIEADFENIREASQSVSTIKHAKDVAQESLGELEAILDGKGDDIGFKLSSPTLNDILGGITRQSIYTIAARSGIGKSAFMLNIASDALDGGFTPLIFSLEMSRVQLIERMASIREHAKPFRVRKYQDTAEWNKVQAAITRVGESNIFIDDSSDITPMQLRSRCKQVILRHPNIVVLIDYLQLISTDKKSFSREQEVASVMRNVRFISKSLNVPVILLAQLNREAETAKPTKAMLRESGSIENDSHVILLISKTDDANTMLFDVAKNRHGRVGEAKLIFDRERQKFTELGAKPERTFYPDPPDNSTQGDDITHTVEDFYDDEAPF